MPHDSAQYDELTRAPCRSGLIARWLVLLVEEVGLIEPPAGAAVETDGQTDGLRVNHKCKPSQADERTPDALIVCIERVLVVSE